MDVFDLKNAYFDALKLTFEKNSIGANLNIFRINFESLFTKLKAAITKIKISKDFNGCEFFLNISTDFRDLRRFYRGSKLLEYF